MVIQTEPTPKCTNGSEGVNSFTGRPVDGWKVCVSSPPLVGSASVDQKTNRDRKVNGALTKAVPTTRESSLKRS